MDVGRMAGDIWEYAKKAPGFAMENKALTGAIGLGFAGAGYMAYRGLNPGYQRNTSPTEVQVVADQQQRGQGVDAPPPKPRPENQARQTYLPNTAELQRGYLDEAAILKERVRLAKEKQKIEDEYKLTGIYQHALGYNGGIV